MRFVGFDGKKIRIRVGNKTTEQQWFEALLGVGVTVDDYKNFVKEYDIIIEDLFKSNGLIRNRGLYTGSDLTSIFYGQGINLFPLMIEKLLGLISFVDIYFHYIPKYYDENEKVPNRIGVYYEEEVESLTNVQFIDLVMHHFPALCCYSYLQELKLEIKDTTYFIDECPILLQSMATVAITKHPQTRFLFRGDQVNHAINAADIFCRFIEEVVKKEGILINKNLVSNLGFPKEKVEFHYISPKWLNIIKPARRTKLNVNHKYPHPIYFLFTDKESAFSEPRKVIENSNLYNEALKKASMDGGSVKFFESQDQLYMNNQDFLISHTKNTDRITDELKRLGCPAKIIDYSFFINN